MVQWRVTVAEDGGFATDDVEPFLHGVLVYETGVPPLPLGAEELVEVELVHVVLLNQLSQVIGHLVGHHHHGGQFEIRIWRAFVGLFHPLLVLIGPVEDLVLQELAIGDGTEGRSAQIEIILARNGHLFLVEELAAEGIVAVFLQDVVHFEQSLF